MKYKAKILIVDDEAPMRFVMQHLLHAEGYDVTTASDGCAAVEIASKEHFDVIITDLIMPRKDGIETILQLRVSHPDTRIIAMSGGWNGGAQSYLRLAEKIGASRALAKPFDKATLLDAIESEARQPGMLSA